MLRSPQSTACEGRFWCSAGPESGLRGAECELRPAEWMLLLLSSGVSGVDLVECGGGELFQLGVGSGADFESS